VKVVRAVDTSGEESLRRELTEAIAEKRRAERAEAAARIQYQILHAQHERLRAEFRSSGGGGNGAGAAAGGGGGGGFFSSDPSGDAGAAAGGASGDVMGGGGASASAGSAADVREPRFVLETVVPLKQTNCRVLAFDARHATLLCSGEGPPNPFARGTLN
jgi:hypothetical protein